MSAVELPVAHSGGTPRGLPHAELEVVARYLPRVLGVRTDHRRIPHSGDRVRVAVLRAMNSDRRGDLQVSLTDREQWAEGAENRLVKGYGLSPDLATEVRSALIALAEINDTGSWALHRSAGRGPTVTRNSVASSPYGTLMRDSIARMTDLAPLVDTIHVDIVFTDPVRQRGRNEWLRFVARSGRELAALYWRDLVPAIRAQAWSTGEAHSRDVAQGHVRKIAKQLGIHETQLVELVSQLVMWVTVYDAQEIRLG